MRERLHLVWKSCRCDHREEQGCSSEHKCYIHYIA